MIKTIYYIFIGLALVCALLRLGFIDLFNSKNLEENLSDKFCKFYEIIGVLSWVFIVLGTIVMIIGRIKGVMS